MYHTIQDLAQHFAMPTNSSSIPLPRSSASAPPPVSLSPMPSGNRVTPPEPGRRVSAPFPPQPTQDEYQHHHSGEHRRSVIADISHLQGLHQHQHPSPADKGSGPLSNLKDLMVHTVTKKVIGRLIIVGDVHGCPDQLYDLARHLKYDKSIDLLVIAGDLVNKGPDSVGAVSAAIELGALAVIGNHDITVLEIAAQIEAKELDPYKRRTAKDPAVRVARDLPEDCLRYLRNLPHILKIPQYNLLVLHAGVNITYSLENQTIRDLTHLRRLAWNDNLHRYDSIAKGSEGTLWAKLYKGPETIVFGHDARSGLQDEAFAVGLDTGCCYGGALTAVVYPGRKIVSVPGLPQERRLQQEEDADETLTRLDTPTQPSPPISGFYDPVPISSARSTPSSTLMPSQESFPMAPKVQQFFQKHKDQLPLATQHRPSEGTSPVTNNISSVESFFKNFASPARAEPTAEASVATPLVAAAPATSSSDDLRAKRNVGMPINESVQYETLLLLFRSQQCLAVLALLRHELYKNVWDELINDPTGLKADSVFWADFVEMAVSFTLKEKNLTDDILELVDLLLEVLHEKRDYLPSKAIHSLNLFASRLESGEMKGLSKGVLKAIRMALK